MPATTFDEVFSDALQAHRRGALHEAIDGYRRAAAMRPGSAVVQNNLSLACKEAGDGAGAIAAGRAAVALAPHRAEFRINLANVYRDAGRMDESIATYRDALAIDPASVAALNNLGVALQDSGRIEDAIACFRRAVELDPNAVMAHGNLLYAMYFDPRFDAAEILREHRAWAHRHADPLGRDAAPYPNDRSPDRPLRVGYVSAHLYDHVVGRFMLPLLRSHAPAAVETFCYADEAGLGDPVASQLKAAAGTWRPIRGMSDEQVAALVREDRIDILVDLAMHMAGSRLLVFARKPAPVQVTYLAYAGTTGMEAMAYRLTDPFLDPTGADADYAEQSVRIGPTYWCYEPPQGAGDPGPPPARAADGVITFACLNSFAKVSPAALRVWCRLLREVPRSRLLLHAREGAHRTRVTELFAAEGVDPRRLNFIGFVPISQYFDLYRITDIALDPFPYAGGTTTCDAIWAGVSVVTLRGRTAVGRGGVSILSNVGAPELIASFEDQYVRIASTLARDPARLAELRRTLRGRMQRSPLMDARGFARSVESAYRTMWRNWCAAS